MKSTISIATFILAVLFLTSCSSIPPSTKAPTALAGWHSLPQVARACGVKSSGWQISREGANLTTSRHKIRLFAESRRMEVNGTLVWLNAPLTAYPTGSTRFFLSPADAADLNTLHQQITSRLPQNKSQRFFTVMLDPGHGGEDSGARSSITGQHEKDLTLDIAKRIGTALARDPIQVVIIRNDDFTMSLDQRTSIAAKNKIDCFVSIHANSAANLNAEGFETYILPAAGYPATNGGEIREPGIGNKWNPANLTLAYTIHNRLVKLGYADRGLKRARFYALQHSTCPAILVEVGFLSNNREARLLNTPAHRQKIADTIAAGIRDYAR